LKRIFILTNFNSYLPAYSPIIVVGDQLKMFQRAGYQPVLIAAEGWEPPEDSIFSQVETIRIFPAHVYNEAKVDDVFHEEVERLYQELNAILEDGSVVISHDLIFLPDYVKHNVACRRIADEKPGIQWLHWVHSATSPYSLIRERAMYGEKYSELLSSKFPHSLVVYPNSYSIPRVARNFGYETDEVVEVPHPTDLAVLWQLDLRVQRLVDEVDLYENDVVMVYPARLDRGKNCEYNVRLTAALKQIGLKAHLIFVDFHSTGDDKVVYREDLKALAREYDIEDKVTFMSEFDESLHLESPKKVVSDLFRLSNVMLMPSKSETYSLVAQEALADGALLILNHDFAPFRQVYGDHAIYRQVGGANIGFDGLDGEINTEYSDIDDYMRGMAHNVNYYLQHDKVLKGKTWVRKERNPDYIFRTYLEPLLYRVRDDG
jgi:glycosyltransferase involved in cell wall biosynthesis